MTKKTLTEQANKLLKEAEKKGIESNYFFVTTFQRYQVQMEMLDRLEEAVKAEGATVEKEYVKGRKNIYTNPALAEYNKTATAANGTVQTLIKIMTSLDNETKKDAVGENLARFIAGGK